MIVVKYAERWWVPAWWWVVAIFLAATFWLAFAAALPSPWGDVPGLVLLVAAVGGLLWYGAVRVTAGPDGVTVGRAHLPPSAIGAVEVLSDIHARVLRGPGADATAAFWLRPYLASAVRVSVSDPDDPTPYWYIATRHPDRLAAALEQARSTRS